MFGKSAEDAWKPFKNINFKPFRDASYGSCTYECTILDCLRGLEYAMKLGWFDFKKFNITEYEHYEKVEKGDLNWIIPNKFIAFSSPYSTKTDKYGVPMPHYLRINCLPPKTTFLFLKNSESLMLSD